MPQRLLGLLGLLDPCAHSPPLPPPPTALRGFRYDDPIMVAFATVLLFFPISDSLKL